MAACTHEAATADTDATPNTSGAFTPVANDLLVVFCTTTDAAPATAALTNSESTAFTQIATALFVSSFHRCYLFVADALSAAVSQTVTFTPTPAGSGSNILVCAVSGMTKVGAAAVKQSKVLSNQAGGGTPEVIFDASALTGNPTLAFLANTSNPATVTAPTSWSELADIGYATPSGGAEYATRDSGFTGTTITWGSTSATAFGAIIVELDASGAAASSGAGVNKGLVNRGLVNAGLVHRSMTKLNEWVERKSGLLVPKDSRLVFPVAVQIHGT